MVKASVLVKEFPQTASKIFAFLYVTDKFLSSIAD
jgi:hypothetical protein